MKKRIWTAVACAALLATGFAGSTFAGGSPDSSFGTSGVATYPASLSVARAVAVQPDGKIVVAGAVGASLLVARYDASGTLDTSFGSGGTATVTVQDSAEATSLLIEPDGKLVVGGQTTDSTADTAAFLVARLNVDGSLDSSFGSGGETTIQIGTRGTVRGLALQSDGKIVAVGDTFDQGAGGHEVGIARLDADGTLDSSFGSGGVLERGGGIGEFAYAVSVESNGDIAVAGQHNSNTGTVWLLDSSGTSLATTTIASTYQACGLALLSSGDLLVGGATGGGNLTLTRLAADGSIDTSYGSSGTSTTSIGLQADGDGYFCPLLPQTDGSAYAAVTTAGGSGSAFTLAHLDAAGAPDTSFGANGGEQEPVSGRAYGIAQQSDGMILLAGQESVSGANHAAVERVDLSGGGTTTSSAPPGAAGALVQLGAPSDCIAESAGTGCGATGAGLDGADWLAISPDGKNVYVASFSSNAVAEFARNSDGSLTQLAGANACVGNTGSTECGTTTAGLRGPTSITVSPDGRNVYLTASSDDTVVVFQRGSDGSLTPLQCLQDAASTYDRCATKVVGLRNAYDIAVSADGDNAYVAAGGWGNVRGDVAEFARASNGTLTQLASPNDCLEEAGDATPVCGTSDGKGLTAATALALTPGGANLYAVSDDSPGAVAEFTRGAGGALTQPSGASACVGSTGGTECSASAGGLADLVDVAVSPDGSSLYTASDVGAGIVGQFSIGSGGALTPVTCVSSLAEPCSQRAVGTNSAFGLALSPDGANLYVAAAGSSTLGAAPAVASFARNSDGDLTQLPSPDDCTQASGASVCGRTGTGLSDALSVVVSPDGDNAYVASSSAGAGGAVAEFARVGGSSGGGGSTTITTTTPAASPTTTATSGSGSPTGTVTVGLAGTGTVVSQPAGIACPGTCTASFPAGTEVTLSATAGSNWNFASWNNCSSVSGPSCTVTVGPGDQHVIALYSELTAPPLQYSLVPGPADPGTASSRTVTLSFWASDPADRWTIAWGDGQTDECYWCALSPTTESHPVAISHTYAVGAPSSATISVQAWFASSALSSSVEVPLSVPVPERSRLTLVAGGNGEGAVVLDDPQLRCTATCTVSVPTGKELSLHAVPADGQPLSGWGGACAGTTGSSCSLAVLPTGVEAIAHFGPAPPVNQQPPSVSDNATSSSQTFSGFYSPSYGAPVYASEGTWTPKPRSFRYQWFTCKGPLASSGGMSPAGLDCSDVRGATGRSYVPRKSDVQNGVGVRVSAVGASNSASDPVSSDVIEVQDHNWTGTKPATATTGAATVQSLGTEATLGGAVIPGFSDWQYRFRWGLVGSGQVHDAYGSAVNACTGGYALPCGQGVYVGNDAQAVSVHLGGLTPNATYWYQLVAYNGDGLPRPPGGETDGAVHRFRASTTGGPPVLESAQFVDGAHPRVDVQVFPGGKPATIAVSWSGPDVQTRSNDVHIDLGPDPGASTVVPLPLPFTPQQTLPYQYTITATTDAGSAAATGAFSSGHADAPQALYPTAIGSTTATLASDLHLGWIGPVDPGYANDYEADAELWGAGATAPTPGSPGTQSMFLAATDENLKTPEQPTHLLSGLSPGTTYHYQVSLDVSSFDRSDSTLQVVHSNVIQFTTANAAPAGASASSSAFSMQMSCLTANGCSGSFEATPAAPFAAGGAAAATAARGLAGSRTRAKHATANPVLAYGRYRIAAHGHATLRVRLTPAGRRWLRAHPRARRLSIAIHNANARAGAVSRAWIGLRREATRRRRR